MLREFGLELAEDVEVEYGTVPRKCVLSCRNGGRHEKMTEEN